MTRKPVPEERVFECDRCGHAYTARYGRDHETEAGAWWLCHDCGKAEDLEAWLNAQASR